MTDFIAGRKRIGWMSGGKAALWKDATMGQTILDKALAYIDQNKDRPFFLFYPSHCVHAPVIPAAQFRGVTKLSARTDQVQELDWTIGQLVARLEQHKLADDTLIVVTSDNGSWLIEETGEAGTHRPNGPFRGVKFTVYEGGHRVPFIAKWPKGIPAGTVCDEPLDLADMLATFAAMTGRPRPDSGPDSHNAWPAFTGAKLDKPIHDTLFFGLTKDRLAVRQGPWKLIPFRENERGHSGGKNENPGPAMQLYNLADDPGETKNLAADNPAKVKELQAVLARMRAK